MNRLIAALAPDDRDALNAHMQVEHRGVGDVLHEPGCLIQTVYFPHDAIVAHSLDEDRSASIETGTVGCEGVVAAAALLGDDMAFERATVRVAGGLAAIPIDEIKRLRERSAAFRMLIGAYFQAYAAQMALAVLCAASHSSEARLSRWLLMALDRRRTNAPLPFDSRRLAEMLGIGRPAVTVVAGTLQTAGLIRADRDGILVIDRDGLEDAACDCYGRVRRVYERLLPLSYQ